MTERELWTDPHRGQRVAVEPLPPHGVLDLIVDDDGLSASARLDGAGARAVRDALTEFLGIGSTYILRRHDEEARRAYVDEGSPPDSLAAARIGIEHVEHHGRPLRWTGSSYPGGTTSHRFRCRASTCAFRLDWSVTGS